MARDSINEMKDSKIMFTMVNTKVKIKFLEDGSSGNVRNPVPGTVLDNSITKKDDYSFYLVNTHCRQGVPTPSHYTVLYDEVKSKPEDIIQMSYKLSYLYYNFSGAVKIPAPIKYAYRLATMISERPSNPEPNSHYDKINGLYFI
jgi:aubergine-like protein